METYPFLKSNMDKKSVLLGMCVGTLLVSFLCVMANGFKSAFYQPKAEEDLYSLTLDGNNPHNGNTEFQVTTKSGNKISLFGSNLSSGSSGDYFVSLSATNKGYIGNGRTVDGIHDNALSNLEYVSVVYSGDGGTAGTLTLTTGVDASHLLERHYLTSGTGVQLNAPANYFRLTADKAYSSDAGNILIESIELRYSNTCSTGEYSVTYGLPPAKQNKYCNMQILQLDLSDYSDILIPGNFTPETLDVVKYTPYGGAQRSLTGKSNDFAYLNSMYYLDFNSGWLSSQTTGKGFGGYSLFDDGDVLTIEGTFVGTGENNLGQRFHIPKSNFIIKNIGGTNYIYNYLPVESIITNTAPWLHNNGLEFNSSDNFITEASDITNVGKLRPYHSDSIVLKRNGYPFSIGTENTNWYCMSKLAKRNGTTYHIDFSTGSINFGEAGSVQSGDTIILDGLFYVTSGDLVYVNGYTARFTNNDGWTIEQTSDNKNNEVVPERLNIGFWNGNYHFNDISKLEAIAATGINVIVGVNPVWNSNWNNILNRAQELGVKFIVDPRPYDSVNGCYAAWDGTCPSYASHPAVMGFFMYDEPSSPQFSSIETVRQQFKATMPADKMFFVNLFSGACGLESLYGPGSYTDSQAFYYYNNYVCSYANTVHADMYGFDSYPLFTDGEIRKSYFCTFDDWAYRCKLDNLPFWFTFLASGHNSGDAKTYVTPTEEQIRWQMSVGLTYGVDGLLGYLYAHNDNGEYHAITDNSGNIINQNLYDDFSTVIHEFREWDEIYKNYVWQGTASYDTGSTNMMLQNLSHKINLSDYSTSVSADQDLLIGVFANKYSYKKAYMITNAGSAPKTTYNSSSKYNFNLPYTYADATVTITFDGTYKGVNVYNKGVVTYTEINSNSFTLPIEGLDGAFIEPTNN